MWCRTILTAVAISYVICMLLWSGLQKEDLDPSTLEKLARYNINIDDTKNPQLREECLVPHVTTDVQREILKISTANERNEKDITVGIYPKIGMLLAANFKDRTVIQHEANINMTNNVALIPVIGPNLGNATQVLRNKGIIKIEYNIQNQPNVESIINFWTKLTRLNTTDVTTPPTTTTTMAPVTTTAQTYKAKKITAKENLNNGYVRSKEMEYFNRILAEYLASQTVPTTTQRGSTKKVFTNYFPKKYWEISSKVAVVEDSRRPNEQKEINRNTLNNVTEDDLHKIQETLNRQIQKNEPKVRQSKSVKRNKTIGLLERLLQMRNGLFNNGLIIPETESNTETIKTNKRKENQEATISYNLFKLFQNMEAYKNKFKNGQSTHAPKKAEIWEPVPLSNENLNMELNTSSIGNKESNQEQKLVIHDVFETTPSKIAKPERTTIYHVDNGDTNKSSQNFDIDQNKSSETTNSDVRGKSVGLDKQQQNENVPLLSGKKAVIGQQPVTTEKIARNQLFKMKNDTFNADSGDTEQKNISIQKSINNIGRYNEQLTSVNLSDTKATQNVNMSDVQAIPSYIIKQIAENVKIMILKDMGVGVNTTTAVGNRSTISTTVAPTTIFSTPTTAKTTATTGPISEQPSTLLKNEFTQTSHVMQDLLELFKEFKAIKDTVKFANQLPKNTTTVSNDTKNPPQLPIQPYPVRPASNTPYLMINPLVFKPGQVNSDPRIVQVPISSAGNPPQNMVPQFMPPLNAQPEKGYHFGAITIQTNSHEIAPLAIEISKPLAMHHNIVVTPKRTIDQLKFERDSVKYIDDKIEYPKKDVHVRGKFESDLPNHVRFAEKHDFRDRNFKGRYLDREKPWYNHEYHEKLHNIQKTNPVKSRFPEIHYPGRLNPLGHPRRPKDLSYSGDLSHPRGYNRPGFNEPGYKQNDMGRGHRPGSYGNSGYDRQPRYEATKFHEKLERIENWPRGAWKDFHPSDSSNEISARQQLPLVKKQRTRYDDRHFTNFMKSQQKVTDMLEELLANNDKNSGQHSVETP